MSKDPSSVQGKVIVVGQLEAKPQFADEVEAIGRECIEHARSDRNALTYRIVRSDSKILLFEEYTNVAAFQAHRTSPFMKATFTRMGANKMLAGEPDVRFWKEIVVPQKRTYGVEITLAALAVGVAGVGLRRYRRGVPLFGKFGAGR